MITQVRKVSPGMILLRDLVHDGQVLLKSDSVLSAAMISVLKLRGISHVDVKDTGIHDAPGADVYYKQAMTAGPDDPYQKTRAAVDALFSTADLDEQAQLLKYCLLRQLEEKRGESD